MKLKYSLMRKSGVYKWNPCVLQDTQGKLIRGGRTTDKNLVLSAKREMEKLFPDEKYAILELEERRNPK